MVLSASAQVRIARLGLRVQPGTLMPDGATTKSLTQCSRESPDVQGSWHPSPEQVSSLEAHLPDLSRLQDHHQERIEHPEQFSRQYFGIITGGRRMIYINAVHGAPSKDWRTVMTQVCDGGPGIWGALYDPATQTFSDLATNGPYLAHPSR